MMNWLQPPRLRVGDQQESEPRRVSWLELFYDLVFVVAVSELSHNLSGDVSLQGFISFVALFLPVWWAWIGTTFYANRFDTDTIVRRVLMGLQMLAIAALAVNIHHGLSDTSVGFALAYVAARCVLVLEYLWAGLNIDVARGLAIHYATGFSLAIVVWLFSIALPMPYRLICWGIGLLIDFLTPLTAQRHQARLLPHPEHLPERFGLFTIIVLGEAIIAVVSGVSEMDWSIRSALAATLGFITAFCLWWIYFDNVDGSSLRAASQTKEIRTFQLWLYVHLPLVIGLAGTGVGVEQVVLSSQEIALPSPQRWLICGSMALCYVALAVLHRTGIIFSCKARTRHRLVAAVILLVVAIAGITLSPIAVIGAIAIVSVAEVGLDVYQGRPAKVSTDLLNTTQ